MVSIEDFLVQFFQPYFFYSLVFASIALVCIKVFLQLNPAVSRRSQSLLYLMPLSIPVFVFALFCPQPIISLLPSPPHGLPFFATTFGRFHGSPNFGLEPFVGGLRFPSVVSITGLICIGGAVTAVVYLAVTLVFGKRLAMRTFHVVMMSPEEYVTLQEKVKEMAHKIGVLEPKVGLTEDLRPNAFTLGCGRNAVLVFSLGILKMLDDSELEAVVSHELAHVKAQDYLFRSISYSLNLLSFFNPMSYFAVSQAQKERELLADETGVSHLSQPALMAKVLAKLGGVLKAFPKEGFTNRLSASLFLVSPLIKRPELLAAHPQIAHRVSNINAASFKPLPWTPRRKVAASFIIAVLIMTALVSCYALVQIQNSYLHTDRAFLAQNPRLGALPFTLSSGDSGADRLGSMPVAFNSPGTFGFLVEPPSGNFSAGTIVLVPDGSNLVVVANGSATLQIIKIAPHP